MRLQTQHLTIRRYQWKDLDALYTLLSHPVTMQYWPEPFSQDGVKSVIARNIKSYLQYGFGRYAVNLKSTGELVGHAGVSKMAVAGEIVNDLGYIIHYPYWGHGYATEAAAAIKTNAFKTLQLDSLSANMPWDHNASRRVAEKIGMQFVKEFQNERNRNIRTLLYTVHNQQSPL